MPPRFQRSRGQDLKIDDYEKEDEDDDIITDTTNRVNDWSLEVEEEAERTKKNEKELGHHRGGLLRLPPDAMNSSTPVAPNVNNDWRANSNRDFNHYDNNNPAWRGMDQSSSRPGSSSTQAERYLFDPRNPKKPILAPRGNRDQHQHQRFPMDPRFANPPAMHQQQQHHQQHPGSAGPRMPSSYRPPFPATSSNQAVQSLGKFILTIFSDLLIF